MLSFLLLLVFLCEISESSPGRSANEIKSYDSILNSLNVTELNVSTLNVLLTKLKLQNCSSRNARQADCRHRVSVERYV